MTWFFLTIVAVLFIVIETIFEKKTLATARSMEFAAMFAFGNAIVLAPFVFVADLSQINIFVLGTMFLASLPSAGASFLIFKTIKHNQLSEAAPILALLPLVVAIFAFVLLGEKMTMIQLIGLLVIVGGMILLELKNFKFDSGIFCKGRGKYIAYIILYLLIGGVSAIFDRIILFRWGINPLTYLVFIQFFIALSYIIFFFANWHLVKELKNSVKQSWKVIFLISILVVIHRYMYASAIQVAANMGMVVAVYKLSSLFHVFSGSKFFYEDGIFKKAAASIVILIGTILLVIK